MEIINLQRRCKKADAKVVVKTGAKAGVKAPSKKPQRQYILFLKKC